MSWISEGAIFDLAFQHQEQKNSTSKIIVEFDGKFQFIKNLGKFNAVHFIYKRRNCDKTVLIEFTEQ